MILVFLVNIFLDSYPSWMEVFDKSVGNKNLISTNNTCKKSQGNAGSALTGPICPQQWTSLHVCVNPNARPQATLFAPSLPRNGVRVCGSWQYGSREGGYHVGG